MRVVRVVGVNLVRMQGVVVLKKRISTVDRRFSFETQWAASPAGDGYFWTRERFDWRYRALMRVGHRGDPSSPGLSFVIGLLRSSTRPWPRLPSRINSNDVRRGPGGEKSFTGVEARSRLRAPTVHYSSTILSNGPRPPVDDAWAVEQFRPITIETSLLCGRGL